MVGICKELKNGARFQCQGCGYCCADKEGDIFIFPEEIPAIVVHLGITIREFVDRYTGVVRTTYEDLRVDALVIKQREPNGRCVFLEEDGSCTIYPVRPFQCRGFPFWQMNVEFSEDWEETKAQCPGIDQPGGHYFSRKEISDLLKKERQLENQYCKLMKKNKFNIAKWIESFIAHHD